jgi:hypothetical protein
MGKPHVRLARTLRMHQLTKPSHAVFRRKARLTATAALGLCLIAPLFAQDQTPPPIEMTDLEWQLLEKKIGDRANEIANSRQFFERDRRPISVAATLDRPSNVLFLDLDSSFGQDVGDLQLEDLQDAIDVGIEDLAERIPGSNTTIWKIGGHNMDH